MEDKKHLASKVQKHEEKMHLRKARTQEKEEKKKALATDKRQIK